jgi:ABC-type uncharacterized transport system substrate-binding protein
VEARFAETSEGLPALAAELVQLKVDVIVVVGGAPADAARAATKTIPIVLGASPDPVEAGFVASLSRPGGNITGMSRLSPELAGKRLQLPKEVAPGVTRVAVLSNPDHPGERLDWRELQTAAGVVGVSLQYLVVRAFLKATDLCASDPERVADLLVVKGYTTQRDYALQAIRVIPYNRWREYNPEDTVRYALRLHEAGMIKSTPQKILAQGTDWRFFNELKKELKG